MLWRVLTLKPELRLSRSSKERACLGWFLTSVFGVYVLCCTDEGCGAPHVRKLQFLLTVINRFFKLLTVFVKLARKLKSSKIAILNPSIRQDKCLGGGSAMPFPLWWVPWQLGATDLGCSERGHRGGGGQISGAGTDRAEAEEHFDRKLF